MAERKSQIGVVEDDPVARDFFATAIADAGLDLAFKAGTLAEARAALERTSPDLCLVDLGLPDGDGVAFIRLLKEGCGAKALVTTVFGDRATVLRALKAGADGYVLKSLSGADLLRHIRQTLDGFTPISPQVATYLLDLLKPPKPAAGADPRDALSEKESEILTIFSRGLTYAETAAAMGLSANSVRDHVKRIYMKLDVHSRSEALFEARNLGLLGPSDR